jgi:hypothetical protein
MRTKAEVGLGERQLFAPMTAERFRVRAIDWKPLLGRLNVSARWISAGPT